MKRMILWAVILGVVWIAPVWADTAVGYSNVFNINNTVSDTRPKPPRAAARNPYTSETNQYKGQLHDHSHPDGGVPYDFSGTAPEDQIRKYHDVFGYDFLALTDHHGYGLSPGSVNYPPGSGAWAGWAPRSVELTYGGGDPRDGHVLAVGVSTDNVNDLLYYGQPWDVAGNMTRRIRNVHDRSGLAFIAHPDARGVLYGLHFNYSVTVDELLYICRRGRPDAMSIYHIFSHSEDTWDQLLARYGNTVWGYSEDDYHPDVLSRGLIGSTWVSVPGNSLQWDAIKAKLAAGNYYISWISKGWQRKGSPPRVHVSVNNSGTYPVINASVDNLGGATASVLFRVYDGKTYREHSGNQYACSGDERYVRVKAEVGWWPKIYIRSQPIWIDPVDAGGWSASEPGQVGIASSSPELHLRYLGAEEKPVAPPGGYVSQAFEVTTDDGQVPPGAVLELLYAEEDISAIGGTQHLAIYRFDSVAQAWAKVGGTVNLEAGTVSTEITSLGVYAISADLPGDTTAPEVFVDNPVTGGVVNADTQAKATVNDALGAWRVEFSMNGHPLAVDTEALDGWAVNLPYADYCTGDWTLKAVAEDLAGNRGEAEIPIFIRSDTPKPTVAFTAPLEGTVLSGSVTATGTCGDDVAVSSVILYADETLVGYGELDGSGGWSGQIDTTRLANGTRTLKALVEDYPGNEASDSIVVTVNNGASSIGEAKKLDDGQIARVNSAVVTAGTPEMGGFFYIEAGDRSSGIRVATDRTVNEGDRVSIAGILATVNGERQITGARSRRSRGTATSTWTTARCSMMARGTWASGYTGPHRLSRWASSWR